MEVAEEMGLIGFDILCKAKAAVCRCEGGTSEKNPKKIQLHGIKRWWLVYTQLCSGTQKGNSG